MNVPPALLEAISAAGGGKITLVVGAGCSVEQPTGIPVAARCSQECHDRLVANGTLALGDCPEPSNLSRLADAVFAKTTSQQALVEQLRHHYDLKTASPNEGHLNAAALLREGAIATIVTLNFDLALTGAIQHLGVGDEVGVIDGPNELGNIKKFNLFYLHRNANADNPGTWVLRTDALASEWKDGWEAVVAPKVLATPIVLFVGIGSSADVLTESSRLIQRAIPEKSHLYQVNPGDPQTSEFFKALGIPEEFFVKGKWSEFMRELAQRLVVEHVARVKAAADQLVYENGLVTEDLDPLLARLLESGLLGFGEVRANWLLTGKRYLADHWLISPMVADLLLAAALIARVTGTTAVIGRNGAVDFRRDNRTVATHLFASGRGTRSRNAIESGLSLRQASFRGVGTVISGAIVSGTTGNAAAPITPPADVVVGDSSDSILYGQSAFPVFHVDVLRDDTAQCAALAP